MLKNNAKSMYYGKNTRGSKMCIICLYAYKIGVYINA